MTTSINAAAGPAMGVHRFEALQKTTPVSRASRTGRHRALETAGRPSRPRVAGRQSFAGAVRAEWIKLRTLTSTWVTSVITIAITVLFGAGLAIGYAGSPDRADQAKTMIVAGSVPGIIVVAVLGALVMTGEYASGQIRSSMMPFPSTNVCSGQRRSSDRPSPSSSESSAWHWPSRSPRPGRWWTKPAPRRPRCRPTRSVRPSWRRPAGWWRS